MTILALCTSLLEGATTLAIVAFAQALNQPTIAQKYLSKVGFGAELSSGRLVFYMAFAMGVVYLIKNITVAAEAFYQNFTIQQMNYNFKNGLLRRYTQADYGVYLTRNSSFYVEVVGSDVERMFVGISSLGSLISESMVCFFLISFIICMNPPLALVIFGIGSILGIIIAKGLLPQSYRWGQRLQEMGLYSMQSLLQFFHAFKEIVLLNKSDVFIKKYDYYSFKRMRTQALQTSINALPRIVIEILFVGLFVTAIAFLCLEQESPIQMIGILAGYLYAGFRLMPAMNRIIGQLNSFKAVIPSIERIYQEYTTVSAKENNVDIPTFSFKKSIKLAHVSFCYLNTSREALTGVTLEIKKGECLGIVGETGSGKSTLIDLILGLLHPQEGSILIDKQYPVNSHQWHRCIGYVPQSIYLIDDTIEANIAFGEENIDETKLAAALAAAQLGPFIARLPEGSKTIVGERGVRLSGGERQRIAIARALYRNPDILIFDEATSALDNATETRLMETIRTVSQSRTVIMIAHRLTTLKDCGRIVVMENGKIQKITDYKSL